MPAKELSRIQASRTEAFARLLGAKPMPVGDWPVMKQQMLEDRYAKVMKLCDERCDERSSPTAK